MRGKLKVGQVIDLYNVKDHHVLAPGQTLCDTGEIVSLPQLVYGVDKDKYRHGTNYAFSVLDPGKDAVKVARLRVTKVKEVQYAR